MTGALSSLSMRNLRGQYFMAMEKTEAASWVPQVATKFDSDQAIETYPFVGSAPNMKEWEGQRRRQQLRSKDIVVTNKKFENTIEADIDDLRRDKTGQLKRRIRELGAKAAILPDRLLTALIEGNTNAYDGVAFFGSHTAWSTASNDLSFDATDPDAPTSAEMAAIILAAIQKQYQFKDEQGDPINEGSNEFLVMVPSKYWGATVAAMKNDFTAAGVSNTLKTIPQQITIATNPRLTETAASAGRRLYVFRTDAEIRSLLWQEEDIADKFKSLGEDGEAAFWTEKAAFGGKRICNAALGRFELATRTTLS